MTRQPLVALCLTAACRLALLVGVIAGVTTRAAAAEKDAAAKKNERPNIVLILCDDLGYSDLGCYGGEIRTPNLDRLASQGMRFTQFYNCAVCVMTRAALLTGLYPRQGKANSGLLRRNMVTLGEVLQSAGYRTALTGKWHLGSKSPQRPIDRGFEEYYGLLAGCCNYFNPAKRDPVFYNGGRLRTFAHNEKKITEFPDGFFTTDAFADHAAKTIRDFAGGDKPFFVHVCFTAPHFPLHAKPEDIARYKGKYDQGYFQLRRERHRRQVELGLIDSRWSLSKVDKKEGDFRYDYDIAAWDKTDDPLRERRRMEVYAAMVDHLDRGVGRVLKAIDDAGVADNTLVMFLSDNGGCATISPDQEGQRAYNKQLPGGEETYDFCAPGWGWAQCTPFRRYKVWNYEGGISTPLIARWPGVVPRGAITHQVGHVIDFMPTFVELAGAEYPKTFAGNDIPPVEGKSLAAVLRDQTREGHAELAWALFGNRAFRAGKWKLVWGASRRRWELYNMETDRTETTDLAAKFPAKVAQLAKRWNAWADKVEVEGD